MQMEMVDALARVVPHVGDEPIAGGGHALALGDLPGAGEHMAEQSVVLRRQSLGALDVLLGDDEHVDRGLGRDVPKGVDQLVLIDFGGGDVPLGDLTE